MEENGWISPSLYEPTQKDLKTTDLINPSDYNLFLMSNIVTSFNWKESWNWKINKTVPLTCHGFIQFIPGELKKTKVVKQSITMSEQPEQIYFITYHQRLSRYMLDSAGEVCWHPSALTSVYKAHIVKVFSCSRALRGSRNLKTVVKQNTALPRQQTNVRQLEKCKQLLPSFKTNTEAHVYGGVFP